MLFPIFLPMIGGGGPFWPYAATSVVAMLGLVGFIEYKDRPSFYFDIHKNHNTARIVYHEQERPSLQRITHHNADCLKEKGYTVVNISSTYRNTYNGGSIIGICKKDLSLAELMKDCKTCNTYTEIDYGFKRFLTGDKEYDGTKRVQWSNCRIRRDVT